MTPNHRHIIDSSAISCRRAMDDDDDPPSPPPSSSSHRPGATAASDAEALVVVRRRRGEEEAEEEADDDPPFRDRGGGDGDGDGRKRCRREPRRFFSPSSSSRRFSGRTVRILIRAFLCSMILFPLYVRKTGRWDNEGSWSVGLIRVPPPVGDGDAARSHDDDEGFFGRCGSHLPLNPSLTYKDVAGATGATFVADPFLYFPPRGKGLVHLFAEVKHAPTPGWRGKGWLYDGKGDIGMSTSRDYGRTWGPIRLVLRETFHLSYPFVFDDSGDGDLSGEGDGKRSGRRRVFLIPESIQANSIRLYEASDPTDLESSRWIYRRSLLSGERYVDNTLLYRDGRWWLFTLVNGRLRLFYTRKAGRNERRSDVLLDPDRGLDRDPEDPDRDEPKEGEDFRHRRRSDGWTEHPQSPLGPDVGVVVPRPAGRIFALRSSSSEDGKDETTGLRYYRPAQDGTDGYGRYVRIFRILALNVTHYAEVEEARGIGPTPRSIPRKDWMGRRVHHFDVNRVPDSGGGGFLVAFDGDGVPSGTLAVFAISAGVVWGLVLAVAIVWSHGHVSTKLTAPTIRSAVSARFGTISAGVVWGLALAASFVWSRGNATTKMIRVAVATRVAGRGVRTSIAVAVAVALAITDRRWRTCNDNTASLKPTPVDVWGDQSIGDRPVVEGRKSEASDDDDDVCRATLVTGMFDIGRAKFSGADARESRSFDKYLSWFTDVLSLRSCLVVYVEQSTVQFVWDVRNAVLGPDLAQQMTLLKVTSVDDLRSHPHYPHIQSVVNDASYVSSVRRPGRPEMRIPEYNALMYSKVAWLNETAHSNPFNSDLFFFVDGGYGHGRKLSRMKNLTWPDPAALGRRIHPDKLFIVQIRHYDPAIDCDDESLDYHARRHRSVVMGAFFGGTSRALGRFAFDFEKALTRQLDKSGAMDDEQQIIFGVKCKRPSSIDLNVCERHPFCKALGVQPCWDSWHCPIDLFEPLPGDAAAAAIRKARPSA